MTENKQEKYARLYQTTTNLEELSPELSDEFRSACDAIEDGIVGGSVADVIRGEVAPRLADVRRGLTLMVEYRPGQPVRIAVAHRAGVIDAMEGVTDIAEPEPVKTDEDDPAVTNSKSGDITRGPSSPISVSFASTGQTICHPAAIDTMIDALRVIGFEAVSNLGIVHSDYNLVGKVKRTDQPGHWQRLVDGWFIYVNISNDVKVRDLRLIAQRLGIDMTVTWKGEEE